MSKMQPPNPLPKYVYKIIPTAPPSPIPSPYPLSALDEKDGFVHLSTSWQVRISLPLPNILPQSLRYSLSISPLCSHIPPPPHPDPNNIRPLLHRSTHPLDPQAASLRLRSLQGQMGRGRGDQRLPAPIRQLRRRRRRVRQGVSARGGRDLD